MVRYCRQLAALAIALLVPWLPATPALAQAEDPSAYGDEYGGGDFGRVTYQENGVAIHRAVVDSGLPAREEARINAPVYPGDTLLAGADQRAEVQLAGGSLVRIDRGTELTFLGLPDPYAEFSDNTVLQLAEGTIRITTALNEGEEFRLDTPDSSVYFLGDGDFRIEVTPTGRTEVISRRGVAEVVGNGGSVLVRGGMRTEVLGGSLPEEPWAFNTFVADGFDRWVDDRDAVYRAHDRYLPASEYPSETYETLPQEVQPYYQELNYYGDWTYVADLGYVWYPRQVPATWQPYYDGHWSYGPGGYFWVSSEPWGWAPYHYGRWSWVVGYGWCWAPGRVFAGAWVAWSWGSAYVGWAPLDYWGRPCHRRGVYHGYYDPHVWSFVHYDHIGDRHHQRYAVRVGDVGDHVRHATVSTSAPRVSPTRLARSRESREMAARQARENRKARMRPVDRDTRPAATMNDVERRLRPRSRASREQKVAGERTGAPRRSPVARGRNPQTRPSSDRAGSRVEAAQTERRAGRRREFPSYSRRITAERSSDATQNRRRQGRSTPAASTRSGSPSAAARGSVTPRVRSRENERGDTDQRVRDLYRKMAGPSSGRERAAGEEPRRVRTDSRSDASRKESRSGASRRSERSRSTSRAGSSDSRSRSTDRKRDEQGAKRERSDDSRSRSAERKRDQRDTPGRRPGISRSQTVPGSSDRYRRSTSSPGLRREPNRPSTGAGPSRARLPASNAGSRANRSTSRPSSPSASGSRRSTPSARPGNSKPSRPSSATRGGSGSAKSGPRSSRGSRSKTGRDSKGRGNKK
jgi:hypothetical protein